MLGHEEPDMAVPCRNPLFTILVVDREPPFDVVLDEHVETHGHFVLRAPTMREALAKAREFEPNLILLNRDIEGAEGLAVIPEILMECPSAALVLMASKPRVEEAVEAMRQGAVDYLPIPLDPDRLRRVIETQKANFKLR